MYGYGFYYDRTYILLIIGMLLSVAQPLSEKYFCNAKECQEALPKHREQAARRILQVSITDVQSAVSGNLTDHYDPRTKTINLSRNIFGQNRLWLPQWE